MVKKITISFFPDIIIYSPTESPFRVETVNPVFKNVFWNKKQNVMFFFTKKHLFWEENNVY